MKKIYISLFIFSQLLNLTLSQGIDNVDKLNGYREFKFGMKVDKVDTCFRKSEPFAGIEPEEDYTTFNPNYNKFLRNNSDMFLIYLDKGILYKIEFWFKDKLLKARNEIGMQTTIDYVWKDLVKLFGEPNKPIEINNDIYGSFKTYTWEGENNIIEFQVFKEGENLNLIIYNKKLNNDFKLSQFR